MKWAQVDARGQVLAVIEVSHPIITRAEDLPSNAAEARLAWPNWVPWPDGIPAAEHWQYRHNGQGFERRPQAEIDAVLAARQAAKERPSIEQRLAALEAENAGLKAENADLKARVLGLESWVQLLTAAAPEPATDEP